MKQGIHPKYETTTMTCACGASYTVRSTRAIRKLEICSACHPFFSGKNKLIDTAGRVDKFNQRFKAFDPAKLAAEKAAREEKARKAAEAAEAAAAAKKAPKAKRPAGPAAPAAKAEAKPAKGK